MIRIVLAYPDLLNLYGDAANVKLLSKRLSGCGERTELSSFSVGSYCDISRADLLVFGAGTENRMLQALLDFRRYRGELERFVAGGGRLLATGNSGAIFCRSVQDDRTQRGYEGMGLFAAHAVIGRKRRYSELVCEGSFAARRVLGCVNSSLQLLREEGQAGMHRVLWDSTGRLRAGSWEGLASGENRLLATELTGPLFFRNPSLLSAFAAALCSRELPACTQQWYGELEAAYRHALEQLPREAGR